MQIKSPPDISPMSRDAEKLGVVQGIDTMTVSSAAA